MSDYLKAAKIHIEGDGLRIITQNSYGYGDILRLMAYARSLMWLSARKVHVTYVIPPEYNAFAYEQNIHDVLNHFNLTTTYDVEMSSLDTYAHKYTNLLKKEYAEQVATWLGYPKLTPKHRSSKGDYVCVWTPWTNLSPVSDDKMPINKHKFESFLKSLDIPIKMVDYRMDIVEAFDLIRNSKLCLGYEGMGQQVAYHYGKPIISMSNLVQVSKNTGGPDSRITDNLKTVRRYLNVY